MFTPKGLPRFLSDRHPHDDAGIPVTRRTVLTLAPEAYLAAYRAGTRTLYLPAFSDGRPGAPVIARIALEGQATRAVLSGTIQSIVKPDGAIVLVDEGSMPAAQFLARAARGETLSFRGRAPRLAAERRARLRFASHEITVAVQNLSEGGCYVSWSHDALPEPSPLPKPGDAVALVMADARGAAPLEASATVCWTSTLDSRQGVGLRLDAHGVVERLWRDWIAEAARSGAFSG